MAGTRIKGPSSTPTGVPVNPMVLSLKKAWGDDWEIRPDATITRGGVHTAGHDLDSVEFTYRYGKARSPHEDVTEEIETREAVDLAGYWVKLELATEHGLTTEFIGKVESPSRIPHGRSDYPAGVQAWVAYGPLQILRKIEISQSCWYTDSEFRTLGWVPAMNGRDQYNMVTGNRTAEKYPDENGVYVYGGTSTWTRRQYLDYVLSMFVDEGGTTGPAWTIRGQVDALDDLSDVVTFGVGDSAADVIRKLISTREGFDYFIFPNEDAGGFELCVFALLGDDQSWGGVTLPKNPISFDLKPCEHKDLQLRIVQSGDHEYGAIRVVGRRIVTCCSLRGVGARIVGTLTTRTDDDTGQLTLDANHGLEEGDTINLSWLDEPVSTGERTSMTVTSVDGAAVDVDGGAGDALPAQDTAVYARASGATSTAPGKWSEAIEAEYKAGTGDSDDLAEDHDKARKSERFRPVYQVFGAPLDWDWQMGLARVELDANGEILPLSTPDYQCQIRKTLNFLPMFEGIDYSTTPPTNNNLDGHGADYRNAEGWIFDQTNQRYVPLEEAGITISASGQDWGVLLSASPNHLLGLNHFDADLLGDAAFSAHAPLYDYEDLILTIALETDQRFAMIWTKPGAVPSDGVKVVSVPDAELWYLAPDTMVGTTVAGTPQHSPSDGLALRNDKTALALAMAGAIARYCSPRGKAELRFKGFLAWGHIRGQILGNIIEGPATAQVITPMQSAVTSVEWVMSEGNPPEAMTIIRTGYAR